MASYTVKQARAKLSSLLRRVEGGQRVVITRRSKEVARLEPPCRKRTELPSMKHFRDSVRIVGKPMSTTVSKLRDEKRRIST